MNQTLDGGVHLADCGNVLPCQASPVLYRDRLSPLWKCFRVVLEGERVGIIGQDTVTSPWRATKAGDAFGVTVETRAQALAHVLGREAGAAKERKERKVPTEKISGALAAGTRLQATYKGETHELVYDDPLYRLTCHNHDAQPFKSLSGAGKYITSRVSCEGTKFWAVIEAVGPAAAGAVEADECVVARCYACDAPLGQPHADGCDAQLSLEQVETMTDAQRAEMVRKERNRLKNAARDRKRAEAKGDAVLA